MGGGGRSTPSSPVHHSRLTRPAVNVAYDGTFGDLSSAGDAGLFDMGNDFTFDSFVNGDAVGGMSSTDFTAINGNVGGVTVSPKDVFNTDSVPPSTSFTNLTTPGSAYLDTPDDDYQTSPLFSDNLDMDSNTQYTGSLFPEYESTAMGAPMIRNPSASSINQIVVHPGGDSMSRKRSSTTASPMYSPAVKHSTVAGVGARKRDKPLAPIIVNEDDPVALKRARNTAAARKSRAKKVQERDELETEIADLKAQVEYWKSQALGKAVSDVEE
jgi:general control protein GCN4